MKIFDGQKKKDRQDEKTIVLRSKSFESLELNIHNDIENLIWFKNGKRINYNPKHHLKSSEYFVGDTSYKIEIQHRESEDPSLIDTKLAIKQPKNITEVDKLSYFPSYGWWLTPEQRWVYLQFLSNPYDTSYELGYTFLLYYGLERFLLTDKFEIAFEVILKLRDVHATRSFQRYSGNALMSSCLYHQRPDMMAKFIDSIDKDYKYSFSDNLFLFSSYIFEIPLQSKHIVRLAKTFEFTKKNFITKYPELFSETMTKLMREKIGKNHILLSEILDKKELNELKVEGFGMFANGTISDKLSNIPLISESFVLKKTVYGLLEETQESVKTKLAELKKKGIALEPQQMLKPKQKEKIVLVFDDSKEKELLGELKKNSHKPMDRHFTYIDLQAFYYTYRDLDRKYLEKCIEYCEEDIKTLNDVQKSYISTILKRLKNISEIDDNNRFESEKDIESEFKGYIPAFSRLAIIYEKEKEYKKAIEICNAAIQYNKSLNMDTNEFTDRKERLLMKIQRAR